MSRGNVTAEFAIVSVAMFTLIFGVIDFGRALYTYHLISNAARIGTRYAIVNASTACAGGIPDPLKSYVSNTAPGVDPNSMGVTTNCGPSKNCQSTASPFNTQGCLVTVTVTYPFNFLIPLVSTMQISMSSTSKMIISQ